ncbi:unnamed protein product [Protopolystoma xenopodis]|uniref:CSD domain-containing protein n=1 Tax=Protopolystoma xenopodis TaxID=117903 RepID=A0A448WKN7_9PLAT|nr:unnamed protein product [Protopolystoma xenopodis]
MEKRYGFIQREDVDEDVFVHRSGILKYKNTPCLWKGLKVEFSVVETSKGIKAESVTGPNGEEIALALFVIQRRRVRRSIRNQEEGGGDGEYRRQRRGPGRPRPGNEETDGTFYDPMGPYSRSRNRPDENGDQEEELPNIRGGRRGRGRPRGGRGMRSYGQGGGDIDEQYAEENYQNGENNGMAPGPRIRHRRPRVRRNDLNIQEGDNACPEGTVFNINGINKSERRGIPRRRGNRG